MKERGDMRENLGVFLLEKEDGSIDVQLHADPDKLDEMYKNLVKLPMDKDARATMISVTYGEGGPSVSIDSKALPVPLVPAEERPDGIRLGEGPIHLPKEDEDE